MLIIHLGRRGRRRLHAVTTGTKPDEAKTAAADVIRDVRVLRLVKGHKRVRSSTS